MWQAPGRLQATWRKKEYYILGPENKHMVFYERSATGDYVEIQPDANGVIHSNVLPGFQFRVRDLDHLPLFEELLTDEVYYYVLPGYRAALARAEEERQRAEQYAVLLRSRGVNVDTL